MDTANTVVIIVAIIGAIATIISNIIISNNQSKDMDAKLDKNQAVIEERINNLKETVDKHNNFGIKIPAIEQSVNDLKERVSNIENKINSK